MKLYLLSYGSHHRLKGDTGKGELWVTKPAKWHTPKQHSQHCLPLPVSSILPWYMSYVGRVRDQRKKNNCNRIQSAIQDIWLSPHCAANCLQHVLSSGPGTNHVQHTERSSHATCPVTCQLISLTEELKLHLFELYVINRWRRGGNPEKVPDDELQKMPRIKVRRLKPQPRLEPAQ